MDVSGWQSKIENCRAALAETCATWGVMAPVYLVDELMMRTGPSRPDGNRGDSAR